ncbi:MAG: hypothetical protein M1823_005292 [Watsoniomyces obsoletus]|nr:MAG: hypothetical protein M1823_005292 [Watsoniomyces obsoletus]
MRQDIANQTAAGTAPRQIESALRLQHPDLTITRDDIRNTRKAIKHDNLGQNSPIQAPLLQLQSSD